MPFKLRRYSESGKSLTGSFLSGALYRALAVSELNASMGRIVAAPTAGSCGILPAALITMQEEKGCSDHDCVMALFTASAVGMVIANNASLAGAQGGCQAECGSAAAMAAAAITELAGGTPHMVSQAVAIALKNILGLVCDPVAGLVEIPCIKRNASGVAGAFVAAEMALAGIDSAIPADEVILVHEADRRCYVTYLKRNSRRRISRHTNRKKASRPGIRSWQRFRRMQRLFRLSFINFHGYLAIDLDNLHFIKKLQNSCK